MLNVPLLWWLARSTGLLAEGALLGATLCGLGVAGGLPFLPRKRAYELHETWTLAALLATTVHVVAIVADAASHVPAIAIVVPFASSRLPAPVAVGTLALWGLAVVATSSVYRRSIPHGAWRALHAVAYATFVFAVAHGLVAGTDTRQPAVLAFHATAAAAVVAASVWRALQPDERREVGR